MVAAFMLQRCKAVICAIGSPLLAMSIGLGIMALLPAEEVVRSI
jgi:hypothetical protein